ncbi:hypothetical protein ACIRP0_36845 [Streptomyces sp. NPDC101733]|uniref:hypothetical protein n=1 Tax=unclassified Streptomyces TaxID=2593676 RepID=UPI00380B6BA3
MGAVGFEAVVSTVRDTCAMLADGHPAILAGPDGEAFGSVLQREYLALLAVLMTGRADLEIIAVPIPGGEQGWAVVEPDIAADPRAVDEILARILTGERERDDTLRLLHSWHDLD